MKYSDDALLQAAATIVAAQITTKSFKVTEEDEVASAIESALLAVAAGWARWEHEQALSAAAEPFPDKPRQDKPRRK